jgi:hypothetical protein
MEHPELVVVKSCGNRLEAELVKGVLEDAGIPAMMQGDTVGGMREHIAWSGAGFRILVREEDASLARDVLNQEILLDEGADPESKNDDDPGQT